MVINRLKFQRKLMILFVGMALLPTAVLVFVSYHLISRSVERWANHQIALTLTNSAAIIEGASEIAHTLELYENLPLTDTAELLAVDEDLVAVLDDFDSKAVEIRASELADTYGDYLIAVYGWDGHLVFSTHPNHPPETLTTLLGALEALPDAPTISDELADQGLLICGVPIFSEDGRKRLGAVVVGKSMALTLAQMRAQMSAIQNKLSPLEAEINAEGTAYRRTERDATIIALLITAALIVVVAFFVSKLLAKGVNTPIRSLVTGTEEISNGNLDYQVAVQTDDEFALLAGAFNRMVTDLKARTEELRRAEKIAAWQDIAQKLAHEIKNPLTPIQLSAQRLQRRYRNNPDDLSELLERCTQTIITEVEGLRRLLDEFSVLAQMPAPELSPVDLRETLDATLALFDEFPDHIDCQIDFPADLPPVSADADHLKRAFLNLINNALEAMSEDGEQKGCLTIRAFVSTDQSKVFVQFTDTGPGIPPEVRPKLFTPHVSTKRDGMGLGLVIVKKVMTDLGGDIRLEDTQPDQSGATFTLWLRAVAKG
jgi:nitrogen fixation/metabolism regulation signal transduction histidine kinase